MSATEWLTVAEAAGRLKCNPRTLYDAAAADEIPHRRVGRSVRIPRWWTDGDDLGRGDGPTGEPGRSLNLVATADAEGCSDERTRAM